jgi:GNAT superfamily N-acetyltransferase
MQVKRLGADDVTLVAAIDRSEHVDVEYAVIDGVLTERAVTMAEIPSWDITGSGEFSVAAYVDFCAARIAEGGVLLGAFADERPAGLAIVHPSFEPPMAWLSFLHVNRPDRRRGAAGALWNAAVRVARQCGAASMYVSATPTGSAVGFYLSRGCRLADPVHPDLFAHEPDDIHFVCTLPAQVSDRR